MPWTVYNSDGKILQSAELGDNAVTNAKMADDAIDSAELAAGAVDLAHMSVNSIDSDQYVDASIDLAHMSVNSIDSNQYVDGSIDLAHMSVNSIDSDQYVDGSIDLAHMSVNSIDSDQYVDGSIDRVHLAADIVDGTKIADDVIDSEHYAAASIDNEHLADDAVGVAELSATGTASSSTFLRGDNAWAAAGGGKVLQVVSTSKTAASGTSSSSWAAISGFSVAITPSATSSKIFLLASDNSLYRGVNYNYHVTFYRDSTNLGHSSWGFLYGYGQTSGASLAISHLDSPSTTSSITYQIYARAITGGSIDFCNGTATATITAIEIGA